MRERGSERAMIYHGQGVCGFTHIDTVKTRALFNIGKLKEKEKIRMALESKCNLNARSDVCRPEVMRPVRYTSGP